jgi:Helix-turn-helix domain
MSTLMLSACWRLNLTPTVKLALISLADQANDDGISWPGVNSIARRTCLSERSVQRAIADLVELGLLERRERPGTSTVYRITPLAFQTGIEMMRGATESPRQADTPGMTPSHPRGATPSPEGRQAGTLSVNEPSMNRQVTKAGAEPPGFVPAGAWADFEKMRKAKRAPLTDRARSLMWRRLEKLHAAGESIEAVLEQSILHSWSNVFAVKGESNAGKTQPKHTVGRELGRAFVAEHGGSR